MSVVATTTRRKPKAFAWSYSKIKNYRSCPKRYFHVDVQRDVKEEESEQLKDGNYTHEIIAARIATGKPLPPGRELLEQWAVKLLQGHIDATTYAEATGGKILVEQKLAITADFGPCDFFDKNKDPWYRGIGDVVKVRGPVAMVVDWKTGKIVENSEQLALMAACIFAHYPEVQKIRSMFVWLKEDAETVADFTRADMPSLWAGLLPEVKTLQSAHENMNFPPTPGFLCRKWCPVQQCPHHGI